MIPHHHHDSVHHSNTRIIMTRFMTHILKVFPLLLLKVISLPAQINIVDVHHPTYHAEHTINDGSFTIQLHPAMPSDILSYQICVTDPVIVMPCLTTGLSGFSEAGTWSGTFQNLPEGLYTISVEDNFGCSTTHQVELSATTCDVELVLTELGHVSRFDDPDCQNGEQALDGSEISDEICRSKKEIHDGAMRASGR